MIEIPKLEKGESVTISTADGWKFEVYHTESGSLGLTIHEKGKGPDDDGHCVDIFIDEDLTVTTI